MKNTRNNNSRKHHILMADALIGNEYSTCLCSALSKTGIDVDLIVPENRVDVKDHGFSFLKWMPSKSKNQPKTKKASQYALYLLKTLQYIIKKKPQAVHYQFFRLQKIEPIFFILLSFFNSKKIYTVHNTTPHEQCNLDHILSKLIYKNADVLIAHSEYIKKKLITSFAISPQKISVIPHGNFDFYLPQKKISRNEARQKKGYKKSDFIFLFLGYIREYKGIDILIKATKYAIAENKHIKVIIAGATEDISLQNKYKNMIKKLSLSKIIFFTPEFISTEDLPFFFRAADTFVLPYLNIDHSGALHLAYSFSIPVIATTVGDFPESIQEGKSGFLIPPQNEHALSTAMLTASLHREKMAEMGKYAHQLSKTIYSWDNIAILTRKAYGISK